MYCKYYLSTETNWFDLDHSSYEETCWYDGKKHYRFKGQCANCPYVNVWGSINIWVDDIRPAPEGFIWLKSVNDVINFIWSYQKNFDGNETRYIDTISLDHDAGEYARDGGDYIKILDFLEQYKHNIDIPKKFHLHSMNPIGKENMRRIIEHNRWKEVGDNDL